MKLLSKLFSTVSVPLCSWLYQPKVRAREHTKERNPSIPLQEDWRYNDHMKKNRPRIKKLHTLQKIPAHKSLIRGWFSGVILFPSLALKPPPQKVMNTVLCWTGKRPPTKNPVLRWCRDEFGSDSLIREAGRDEDWASHLGIWEQVRDRRERHRQWSVVGTGESLGTSPGDKWTHDTWVGKDTVSAFHVAWQQNRVEIWAPWQQLCR